MPPRFPAVVGSVSDAFGLNDLGIDDAAAFGTSFGASSFGASKGIEMVKQAVPLPALPATSPSGKAWKLAPMALTRPGELQSTAVGEDIDGQAWLGSAAPGWAAWTWSKTQKSGSLFGDALQSLGGVVKTALPIAATVASVVPGVGTAAALALNTASALAQGKSLQDAALQAAKRSLPGGPVAAAAFDAAVGLAKGGKLTDVAVSAARSALPEGPARQAFDVGVQVAHGANAFDAAKSQVVKTALAAMPGGPTGQAAQAFMGKVLAGENVVSAAKSVGVDVASQAAANAAKGAIMNISPAISPVLTSLPGAHPHKYIAPAAAAAAPAMQLVSPGVSQVASAILHPDNAGLNMGQLAQKLGVQPQAVRTAMASIAQSAQSGAPHLVPPSMAAVSQVAASTTMDQLLSKGGQVAPAMNGPSKAAQPIVNAYTGVASPKIAVPPAPIVHTILRHVPNAHHVPLLRLFARHHRIKVLAPKAKQAAYVDAGMLPPAGARSVPAATPVFWTVKKDQFPILVATRVTGVGSRYKELRDANPGKAWDDKAANFKSFIAGEKIKLPSSWNAYVIADEKGEPIDQEHVTGGVAMPPFLSGAPAPTTQIPGLPGVPIPALPLPAPAPTSSSDGGGYANTLPPGKLTTIKLQLGVWGTREKAIAPSGYPGLTDTMPPLGETIDERFKQAVRSFQQWANAKKGAKLATDGVLTKATNDALDAYTASVATGSTGTPAQTPTPTSETPTIEIPGTGVSVPIPQIPGVTGPISQAKPPPLPMPGGTPAKPTTSTTKKKGSGGLGALAALGAAAYLLG